MRESCAVPRRRSASLAWFCSSIPHPASRNAIVYNARKNDERDAVSTLFLVAPSFGLSFGLADRRKFPACTAVVFLTDSLAFSHLISYELASLLRSHFTRAVYYANILRCLFVVGLQLPDLISHKPSPLSLECGFRSHIQHVYRNISDAYLPY